MPTKNYDSQILLQLAGGSTITQASKNVGVSRRTIHRKMLDPLFREQLSNLRSHLLQQAVQGLEEAAGQAVDCLVRLLKSATDTVALQSAKTILELALATHKAEPIATSSGGQHQAQVDRQQWFRQLKEEGFFAPVEAEFTRLWETLEAESIRAQADPAYSMPPADYLPRLSLQERLTSWRRSRYKELGTIEFQILKLVRRVIQESPDIELSTAGSVTTVVQTDNPVF